MEIHAPHGPILTVKEALVHLCIITTGILIALSLQGALEWSQHRQLVRETRQRLRNEIRGNQESIQTVLKGLNPAKTRFIHAIDVVNDLSAPGKVEEAASIFNPAGGDLLSGMSFAFFNTAGYTTAEVTGAFGFMEYSETVKYADTYDLQALYARMQDTTEKDVFAGAMLGTSLLAKPTPTEVEDVKRQLRLALGGIAIMENLANGLNERYSKALTDAP
jgi:hypothetical protein